MTNVLHTRRTCEMNKIVLFISQTQLSSFARTRRFGIERAIEAFPFAHLCNSKTSGFPPALRFSFRKQWCAPILGCAERPLIGSVSKAVRDTGGRPSGGVCEVRRRDPGRSIRCGDSNGLGYRNLDSRASRPSSCNKEGRTEVRAARKETARVLGVGSHTRIWPECREILATDQAPRPVCFEKRYRYCAAEIRTNRPPSRRHRPGRGR
jgi:hypothetical protein